MSLKGLILAAGKGTRLYPVTKFIPKPLLPLGNKLTIEYAIEQLKAMGIKEIAIVIGHHKDMIEEALGDGSKYGLKFEYCEQLEQKGLAHGVLAAKGFLRDDDFVLYLGDIVYSSDMNLYAEIFKHLYCANLNIVKPVSDPRRYGIASIEGDRMIRVVEKPAEPESNLAMAGLYFFKPDIWEAIAALKLSQRGEYEITDAIQILINKNKNVRVAIYEEEWFDTGTLYSFLETSKFLMNQNPEIGEGAVVNAEIGPNVVVGAGAKVNCDSIEDSVVFPWAEINVKGSIKHSMLGGRVNRPSSIEHKILYDEHNS